MNCDIKKLMTKNHYNRMVNKKHYILNMGRKQPLLSYLYRIKIKFVKIVMISDNVRLTYMNLHRDKKLNK